MIHNFLKKLRTDYSAFTPTLITCLQEGYTKHLFLSDLFAGFTVAIISLPLVMAFAIGSGVDPDRGLFTAIIAGALTSLLGGSRFQIGGPAAAYVVIVYEIIAKHGYEGLIIATLLASIILIALGVSRCGALIQFVPYPVTTGFTTGIAIVIFTSMLKDFLGLEIPNPSAEFIPRLTQYISHFSTINFNATSIAILSLVIIILVRLKWQRMPGAILAICVATALSQFFDLPVATVESSFGPIPRSLPSPTFPSITLEKIQLVSHDAIALALLGAIESLLSAVVADSMTGYRHKSNLELIAQGIANIGSALFGGIPAAGSITRTTASVQMHAKTPISGTIQAGTLFLLMFLFAPAAGKIPLATISAILMYVAYNMSEIDRFISIIKGPKNDRLILIITFLLTVLVDITIAVEAGVLLAIIFFLKHMSETTNLKALTFLQDETVYEDSQTKKTETLDTTWLPHDTEVYEIEGPFFFGVADILNEGLRQLNKKPKNFILRMRSVPLVDGSGMESLKSFYNRCKMQHIEFYITEVSDKLMQELAEGGVIDVIGKERFFKDLNLAIAKTA